MSACSTRNITTGLTEMIINYINISLDAWMPYYGGDFDSATKMWSREMRMSYLDCLWHYWSHTKCKGLPNDDDLLRRLCGCELREWARTKGLIFGGKPFFYLRRGKWHQNRSRKERADRLRISRRQMLRTLAATNARNAKRNESTDGARNEQRNVGRDEQRNDPPSHSHSHSQNNSPQGGVGGKVADLIKSEKELVRIGRELGELGSASDHAPGSKKAKRIGELQARQIELRKLLGVTA